MKKTIALAAAVILALCVFTGCETTVSEERYPKTDISKIYTETNKQNSYNITYHLNKTLKYWYHASDETAYDYAYSVSSDEIRASRDADTMAITSLYQKGSYSEKPDGGELASHSFEVKKVGSSICTIVDGAQTESVEIGSFGWTVNKLKTQFNNSNYVDRAKLFVKSTGAKEYVIQYYCMNENLDSPTNACWTLFKCEGKGHSHTDGMTYSYQPAEMELRVFVNSDGLVTKQKVVLNFDIDGRKIKSQDAYGEARFELEINYKW